ncbi:MAG TPA: protein kinase [Polyangiaceae bacterium]
MEKKVALKVLHPEYATKGDIVTRFQQEAISASRIKHPNVLEIFDFGQLDTGAFFLAMEFLEGNDLADEITRQRTLAPARGLRLALQICRALAAAHAKGVVHRDMKPENVFLQRTADGEEIVKIVDFGIAQLRTNEEAAAGAKQRRLTRTGMIFGTPEYMSPEQAGGRHADLRADIYAVGIILYEMFTGAVPFTGETFLGVLAKHLNDSPPAMSKVFPELQISSELERVILRALEKDPDARYSSMNAFSQALAATPEGRSAGRGPVASSTTELIEYQSVPAGAFTEPQFRRHTPESHAATVAHDSRPETASAAPADSVLDVAAAGTAPEAPPRTRAETQTATTSTVVSGKARPGAVVGALLAVALAGAGVGAFLLKSGPRAEAGAGVAVPEAKPAPPREAPSKPEPVAVPDPAPHPTPAPAPVSTSIKLSVTTDPAGATLSKDGFQVCDKTPCDVLAAPNETLELHAVKEAFTGRAKVLAQRDQNVSIKLAAPPKKQQKERLCEVEVDGLKIVRPCGPGTNSPSP